MLNLPLICPLLCVYVLNVVHSNIIFLNHALHWAHRLNKLNLHISLPSHHDTLGNSVTELAVMIDSVTFGVSDITMI